MPLFSLAELLSSALGGDLQGRQQAYQRQLAMNQAQFLNNYHMGMVNNGQVRNDVNSGRYFGTDINGNPITGPDGNPVQGTNATAADNANTAASRVAGSTLRGLAANSDTLSRDPSLAASTVNFANTLPGVQIGGSPAPVPYAGLGSAPSGSPDALGPGAPMPGPGGGLFAPDPVKAARTALLTQQVANGQQQVANGQDKSQQSFLNMMGTLPPALRSSAALAFNKANGTSYPVPGTLTPPLVTSGPSAGQIALGPPSQTQDPYAPNAVQAATISGKAAQAQMDRQLGNAATVGGQVKVMTQQQQGQYQDGLLKLKAQGLSDDEAKAQMDNQFHMGMLGVAQDNSGIAGQRVGIEAFRAMNPAASSGSTLAAQSQIARNMQRASTLQALMQKKDANGNGPDADTMQSFQNELKSIQQNNAYLNQQVNAPRPINPMGGGYGLMPNAGSQVPTGTVAPRVPQLPGFPPNLPGANVPIIKTRVGGASLSDLLAEQSRRARRQ